MPKDIKEAMEEIDERIYNKCYETFSKNSYEKNCEILKNNNNLTIIGRVALKNIIREQIIKNPKIYFSFYCPYCFMPHYIKNIENKERIIQSHSKFLRKI